MEVNGASRWGDRFLLYGGATKALVSQSSEESGEESGVSLFTLGVH